MSRLQKLFALMLIAALSLALMGAGPAQAVSIELETEDGDTGENGEDEGERTRNYFCDNPDEMHPVAEGMAARYDATYEEIMGWFCDGAGFGSIMLALQTAEQTGGSADQLLGERAEGQGWGRIWQELGLIGRPEHAGPPNDEDGDGRPDHAGPPLDDDGDGRPEHAGPPNDADGDGRPDHAGPPNDEDGDGRPDHAGSPGGGQGQGQGQGQGNQGQGNQGQGNAGQNLGDITEECLAALTEEHIETLEALAETYDVEYEDVLELYCEGLTFEEIEANLSDGPSGQGQGRGNQP